jgi:hypothetical protein
MKSALNPDDRRELEGRVKQLSADRVPIWGRMTASQMLAHLTDSLRMALGELAVKPTRLPLRYLPLKELLITKIPIPRGAPTAPELVARPPAVWPVEASTLLGALERLSRRAADDPWPDHPIMGRLSGHTWGVLVYRHMDHHLRQFGV